MLLIKIEYLCYNGIYDYEKRCVKIRLKKERLSQLLDGGGGGAFKKKKNNDNFDVLYYVMLCSML